MRTSVYFVLFNQWNLHKPKHIHPFKNRIGPGERQQLNGHRAVTVWLTGLSGSGKSTLAQALDVHLYALGYRSYVLDGDNLRSGLSADLGFSSADRQENIRRVSEVAKMMNDSGLITIIALISPIRKDRLQARETIGGERFLEVFTDCPLEVCEKRDVKGLYRKARNGEITEFTGIDAPYEAPHQPELHLRTDQHSPEESVMLILEMLLPKLQL